MSKNRIKKIPKLAMQAQQAMTLCVIYKPTFDITKQEKFMHNMKYAMTFLKKN